MDWVALRKEIMAKLPRQAYDLIVGLYGIQHVRPVKGPLTYNQDGLASRHSTDFMEDPRFQKAYRLGEETGSWEKYRIHWRIHVLLWAASIAKSLPGDFVECGVNKGGFSRAVMDYHDFAKLGKKFWLLDTFCGLVDGQVTDEEQKLGIHPGGYSECFEAVQKTFAGMDWVRLVRGPIPDTLPQVTAKQVAYLSIDMNCVEPEIAAAEHFWPLLSPGAVVVLDDYGWQKHRLQKEAFDQFARERGVSILTLPTGQGMFIKPPPSDSE